MFLVIALVVIIASAFVGQNGFFARLLGVFAVLFGATIIVTGMLRLVPGDPVDLILGDQAPQAARIKLAKNLGLIDEEEKPVGFIQQYDQFIIKSAKGELVSYRTGDSVFKTIQERLPYTALLAFASMLIAIFLGPPLGVLASLRRGSWADFLASFLALIGISIPRFWLAPLFILLFAITLHLLPVSGADNGLYSLILPSTSLGLGLAAILARLTRASMLEVLGEDYIRSARAKGLTERVVFWKHALRNALIPVITVVGLQLGALLAGTVVVEKIFNWPGLGLLLLESIQKLDMPLVQSIVLVIAFSYVVINLLTDLAYEKIDPRLRVHVEDSQR